MHYRLLVIALISFVTVYPVDKVVATEFGLETQIWPHMWEHGLDEKNFEELNSHKKLQWETSEENLKVYKNLGVTWNVVVIRHSLKKTVDFKRLHRVIDEHKDAGVSVVFRLVEDPKVYGALSNNPNNVFEYNREYYNWVYSIADEFSDEVIYYLVGNEVDHDLGHNLPKYKKTIVSGGDYVKLLRTARAAIKDVSDKLKVVDHGVSSFTLGLAVADFINKKDGFDAAAKFWSNFRYQRKTDFNKRRLKKLLVSEEIRHRINIAKATYLNCMYYDAVQIHHYFSPSVLPEIIRWIRMVMFESGCDTELIATEIGYRVPFKKGKGWAGRPKNVADWEKYSSVEHAEVLVKDMTILMSYGIDKILYWQARFHHDKNPTATLYQSTGVPMEFIIRPAGIAYKFFIYLMKNSSPVKQPIIGERDVTEYVFLSSDFISVIWADDYRYLDLQKLPKIKYIYDVNGNSISFDKNTRLAISTTPLYIVWDSVLLQRL